MLAGSRFNPGKDDGYLFVVFKPDLLVSLDEFKRQMSELVDRIKATPRQPGVEEIPHVGESARDPALGTAEAWMNGRLLVEQGEIIALVLVIRRNRRWEDRTRPNKFLRKTGR